MISGWRSPPPETGRSPVYHEMAGLHSGLRPVGKPRWSLLLKGEGVAETFRVVPVENRGADLCIRVTKGVQGGAMLRRIEGQVTPHSQFYPVLIPPSPEVVAVLSGLGQRLACSYHYSKELLEPHFQLIYRCKPSWLLQGP